MKELFAASAAGLLLCAGAHAADYSAIDCTDHDTLEAILGDLNAMPALKAAGNQVVDIENPTTVRAAPTQVDCIFTLVLNDGLKLRVRYSAHDNSMGDGMFSIKAAR